MFSTIEIIFGWLLEITVARVINYDANISSFSFYWVISQISQESQKSLVKPKGVELACNFQRMYNLFFCVKQVIMLINAFSNLQMHRNKMLKNGSIYFTLNQQLII